MCDRLLQENLCTAAKLKSKVTIIDIVTYQNKPNEHLSILSVPSILLS
jgi:hypothetical protein